MADEDCIPDREQQNLYILQKISQVAYLLQNFKPNGMQIQVIFN